MDNQLSTLTNSKCESTSSHSFWEWLSLSALLSSPLVRRNRSRLATAARAVTTGLLAISKTLRVNQRLYVAVILMLVLAPIVSVSYQLFDRHAVVVLYPGQHFYDNHGVRWDFWYHKNYFFFFMAAGPFLTLALFCVGVFFLFPEGSKRAYFLAIPASWSIAKVLWFCTVNSNDEFYQVVPMSLLLISALVVILAFFTFDWLMARKYHGIDGHARRVISIIQARKNNILDSATAERLLELEADKLKTFNKQF